MQVSRWGNSLAARLPKDLVERLGFAAGDALTVVWVDDGRVTLARDTRRADALARMQAPKLRLPEDYRFDRDAAHECGAEVPATELRRSPSSSTPTSSSSPGRTDRRLTSRDQPFRGAGLSA